MTNVHYMKLKGNLPAVQRFARRLAVNQFGASNLVKLDFKARLIGWHDGVTVYIVFVKVTPIKHDKNEFNTTCKNFMRYLIDVLKETGRIPVEGVAIERRGKTYMLNNSRATKAEIKLALHQLVLKTIKKPVPAIPYANTREAHAEAYAKDLASGFITIK